MANAMGYETSQLRCFSAMTYLRAQLVRVLMDYFGEDDRRIEHALRVLHHADHIMAERPECDADIVIASTLLHDVGIKVSAEKLGYNTGATQEEYGPAVAGEMLTRIGKDVVCKLRRRLMNLRAA